MKKRLNDGSLKEYTARVSKQFKLSFDREAEKLRFDFRLNERSGDRSESEQYKHLLSKVYIRKQEIIQAFSHQRYAGSYWTYIRINWQCEKGHIVNWISSTELGKN